MNAPLPPAARITALVAVGVCAVAALFAEVEGEGQAPSEPRPAMAPSGAASVGASGAGPGPTTPAASDASAASSDAWRTDQVMVVPRDASALDRIAKDLGADVLRRPGRSSIAVLSVPDGWTREGLIAELRQNPDVARVSRQGVTRGAGYSMSNPWHLQAGDYDETDRVDLRGFTVAVLDTGAAYEDHSDASGTYVASPCLAEADIVDPRDVVNGDDHANDDHQHGTHIASSIVADCDITGSAPGARLMPVKVLDHTNSGVESDLIEGLWWAIDRGADVINMSLTFSPGYAPSPEMIEVLDAAAQADIVMVGASGNQGIRGVGWPAASPRVIAVAAGCPVPNHSENMVPAPYSNWGPEVDLIAPGGCLNRDETDDGYPDGVLAEAFSVGDPADVGLWVMAGTSQAAALTSGAVVRTLAAGARPDKVREFLQDAAEDNVYGSTTRFEQGLGTGALDLEDTVEVVERDPGKFDHDRFYGAVMPLLRDNGDGTVTPGAHWTVLEDDLDPADNVIAWGEIRGEGGGMVSCDLPDNGPGVCTVWGEPVPSHDANGPRALGWEMTLSRIAEHDVSHTPIPLLLGNDDIEQLVGDLDEQPDLSDAVLGMWWEAGDELDGDELAESLVVMNSGTGISTSPFGVVLTPPAVLPAATISEGTGISTSPFGLRIVTFDGTGISTSPFGLKVVALKGTGISTSPFGLLPGRSGPSAAPFCMPDDDDECEDDGFRGTAMKTRRLEGGWWSAAHGKGASAVAGSGMVSAPVGSSTGGEALGAVPYEP